MTNNKQEITKKIKEHAERYGFPKKPKVDKKVKKSDGR